MFRLERKMESIAHFNTFQNMFDQSPSPRENLLTVDILRCYKLWPVMFSDFVFFNIPF